MTQPGPERHSPVETGLSPNSDEWTIMLRSLTVSWAVGATFFLIVLLFGGVRGDARTVLLGVDLIAFTILGMLVVGQERLPRWTLDVCAYAASLIVGAVIATMNNPQSPIALFYLWLSVHSFYFLPWRRAAWQVAFIAVTYAICLSTIPAPFPMLWWTVVVLTVVVICTFVAILRNRVDTLVATLSAAARTDPLTGLRNRRAYQELLDMEIARADRTGRPLALLVVDIDHFKRFNDQYGHLTGDSVLRLVAAELERSQRQVDHVARIGGEEFVALLPDTESDGAYLVAERMRHAVRMAFPRDRFTVTITVGLALYPTDAADGASLFRAADIALLAGKDAGRDCSIVYSGRRLDSMAPPNKPKGADLRRRSADDVTHAG